MTNRSLRSELESELHVPLNSRKKWFSNLVSAGLRDLRSLEAAERGESEETQRQVRADV